MAAQSAQVTAKIRGELGSRANKRLRDAGLLPGVVYGHKEAVVPVTLPHKEVVNHLNRGAHIFDLQLEGKNEKVLVKDVQYDHLGTHVIHVDFTRVSLDEKVKVTIPVELKGTPKGEADGGVLQQIIKQLEIECLVTEIPDALRHNVSDMALNSVLHIKDLHLPPGVRVIQDGEYIVATVKEILEAVAAAPVEGETAEPEVIGRKAEEGAEGAAGAKAEGDAKGKAEGKPDAKK
jgi:large subunit ribosomal protein L25